jgi:Uma2 family endonuclease
MQRVPIPGAPDIAVEVISPSERSVDSQAKVQAYLRYGAQEVWQVFPRSRTVVVHRGATSTTLSESDAITSPLLPGFSLAVTGVFTAGSTGSVPE